MARVLRHFNFLSLCIWLCIWLYLRKTQIQAVSTVSVRPNTILYLPTRGIARKRQDLRFMWAGVVYVNRAGPMLEARVPSLKDTFFGWPLSGPDQGA